MIGYLCGGGFQFFYQCFFRNGEFNEETLAYEDVIMVLEVFGARHVSHKAIEHVISLKLQKEQSASDFVVEKEKAYYKAGFTAEQNFAFF